MQAATAASRPVGQRQQWAVRVDLHNGRIADFRCDRKVDVRTDGSSHALSKS